MNCEKIKEFLITDYLDNEIDEALKKKIDAHLSICKNCHDFVQELRGLSTQLQKAEKEQPPVEVWDNIKSGIKKEQPKPILREIIGNIFSVFEVRKPVLAFAAVCVMGLIVIGIIRLPFNLPGNGNNGLRQDENFALSYLLDTENGFLPEEDIDFGTNIEEYLL